MLVPASLRYGMCVSCYVAYMPWLGFRCEVLAKEADLAGVWHISGIEQASEVFAGLPVAREAVLERIIREVCIITGMPYQAPPL